MNNKCTYVYKKKKHYHKLMSKKVVTADVTLVCAKTKEKKT